MNYENDQMFKGSFSFFNDNIMETVLSGGIRLRMKRVGVAVAQIYFVDDTGMPVDVPEGFSVHDTTHQLTLEPFPGTQAFALAFFDSYELRLHGERTLSLLPQRQFAIQGAPEHRVTTTIPNAK
jgi:hypothetical protein